jgi:DNA-binding transcriptional ArsR family regulator
MNTIDMQENAEQAARLLKTLANPGRLMILCNLLQQENSVGELEAQVGLSQSALSQHLSRMRAEGLVDSRRDGQNVIYRLTDQRVRHLIETLYQVFCGADAQKN